jgi:hypothetical protein
MSALSLIMQTKVTARWTNESVAHYFARMLIEIRIIETRSRTKE